MKNKREFSFTQRELIKILGDHIRGEGHSLDGIIDIEGSGITACKFDDVAIKMTVRKD